MISDATYAEAGVPIRQLGLKWTSWTREKVRLILDHYRVDYVRGASKLELLRELHELVQQRNLSTSDRIKILARPTDPGRNCCSKTISTASLCKSSSAPANRVYSEARRDSTRSADDSDLEEEPEAYPEKATFANDGEANDLDSDIEMRVDIEKHCKVCFESFTLGAFPTRKTTAACSHEPDVCLSCLAQSITSQSRDKMWNHIDCPSCSARLGYEDVRAFATAATFER